mgnify:CR=1 FL=1
MKKTLLTMILVVALGVQGCATVGPDGEKQGNNNTALWVIGGLVVAGAIVTSADSHCRVHYGSSRAGRP